MTLHPYIIAEAGLIYQALPKNMQAVVAFGMTPIEAHQELAAVCQKAQIHLSDRDSALAFMAACNKSGPGMRC